MIAFGNLQREGDALRISLPKDPHIDDARLGGGKGKQHDKQEEQ